jgi:hypothetical protein
MKGSFNNAKQLAEFVEPLKKAGTLIGDNGINLNFTSHYNKPYCYFSAKNKVSGIFIIHTWNTLFESFQFDNTDFKIGFFNIHEILNNISIFDDDVIDIEFTSDNILTFSQNKVCLSFKTSDPELINEGKREFKGNLDWPASFVFDFNKHQEKLFVALKKMSSQNYIFLSCNEERGEIKAVIKNPDSKTTSFSCILDADVKSNFDVVFLKDSWPVILDKKHNNIKLNIGERVMNFCIKSDTTETNYYIAKSIVQ